MEILYRDADIAVVIKPRGLLSQGEDAASVPAQLSDTLGTLFPVHRLDRTVGGVMVYARTRAAAAALSAAVQGGRLQKEYTAIVTGTPAAPAGTLEDELYHDARQNKTFIADRARGGAKHAALSYQVEEALTSDGQEYTRMRVQLHTGRTHQIRVQLASRKMPLVGDGKYGSRQKAAYPALFATGLSFPHPKTGETLSFHAPVPTDFPWSLFAPAHFEIERKFLIAYPDIAALQRSAGCRILSMVQTYLKAPHGETRRVREVREGEAVRYVLTLKRRVSMLRAVEEERELSRAEYEALLGEIAPDTTPIEKTRYVLPFEGHDIEVDVYPYWLDRAIAEVELQDEGEAFSFPPALRVLREVSDDPRYKNARLAREIPRDPVGN